MVVQVTREGLDGLHPLAQPNLEVLKEPLLGSSTEDRVAEAEVPKAQAEVPKQTGAKTQKAASRSLLSLTCEGLGRSRIFKAVVLAGLTTGLLFLLLSNPAGWMVAAAATTIFVLNLIFPNPFKTKQAFEFELGMFKRLFKQHKSQYNVIPIPTINSIITEQRTATIPELVLGAYPNRLWGEDFLGDQPDRGEIGAVVSLTSDKNEGNPSLGFVPYTTKDYYEKGIPYYHIDVEDHTVLSADQLDHAADVIMSAMKACPPSKAVYVHCKAGQGRSAMGIAAYLMKYVKHKDKGVQHKDKDGSIRIANEVRRKTADEVRAHIKQYRKTSTIGKKLGSAEKREGLLGFAQLLQERDQLK